MWPASSDDARNLRAHGLKHPGILGNQRLSLPFFPLQALLGDLNVNVDVLNQSLDAIVVLLLANPAGNQNTHVGVIEVLGELVQDMDFYAAGMVLVKGVVANGKHDGVHHELILGGTVRVRLGEVEGSMAKVDAAEGALDPGLLNLVWGDVGSGDAELRYQMVSTGSRCEGDGGSVKRGVTHFFGSTAESIYNFALQEERVGRLGTAVLAGDFLAGSHDLRGVKRQEPGRVKRHEGLGM